MMLLKKGRFYKVKQKYEMANNVAEYHSSYYDYDLKIIFHRMIFRSTTKSLGMVSFREEDIYEEFADGMIL